jgi:hypothetical protein
MIFHLGGLETNELMEGMKERVLAEEEDHREAPHEPLRPPVTRDEEESKKFTGHQ